MRLFRSAAATTVAVLAIPVLATAASAAGNSSAQSVVTAIAAKIAAQPSGTEKAHAVYPIGVSIQPSTIAGAVSTYTVTFTSDYVVQQGEVIGIGFSGSSLPLVPSDYTFDGVPVTSSIYQNPAEGGSSISVFDAPVKGYTDFTDDVITVTNAVNPSTPGSYTGAVDTNLDGAAPFPFTITAAPVVTAPVVTPPVVNVAPPTPTIPIGSATPYVSPSIKLNHTKAIFGTKVTATISNLKPGSFVTLTQSGGGHSYSKGTGRANSSGVSKVMFTPSSNVNFTYKMTASGTDMTGAAKKASTSIKVIKKVPAKKK